ncbi:hypothetical protein F5Y14DRAFT_266867 [Nemania sp. NC0429]|nr:hypothetical protein F5Y14DRAFT_266867 [Nemania sp. NC0429]
MFTEHPDAIRLRGSFLRLLDTLDWARNRAWYRGYRTQTRSVIPVIVNGKIEIEIAVPDTGAFGNVVTEKHAASLGLFIDRDPEQLQTFKTATGRLFLSQGTTSVNISFPDDPDKTWRCIFAVVDRCAAPMVLGKSFLDMTEIFTRFKHRLLKAELEVENTIAHGSEKLWRLMLMENSNQKMKCMIDGRMALANADTGSDIDLVSLEYARCRGWEVTPLLHDEGFVILANEERSKLAGYVDANLSLPGESLPTRFYVLEGLTSDVVLGDETLEVTEVFARYQELFVQMVVDDENSSFCMIQWVEKSDSVHRSVDEIVLAHSTRSQGGKQQRRNPLWFRIPLWRRLSLTDIDGMVPSRQLGPRNRSHIADIKFKLRCHLDDIDNFEADCQVSAQRKMAALTGAALIKEEELDKKRKEKHRELRQKILREMSKL